MKPTFEIQDELFWRVVQKGIDDKIDAWAKIKDRALAMNILVELVAGCLNKCTSLDVKDFHERLERKIVS